MTAAGLGPSGLTCNISDNIYAITFKLGMTIDLWMAYMLMAALMTLTLMQGHSGSGKAKNQLCMLSATEQTISIKLATRVGHFLRDLDFDFGYVYMACPSWWNFARTSFKATG